MTGDREPLYVCGHSGSELERLEIQGAFFEEITRLVLERAGLTWGMHVLDIGCGAGDVSLLAADIVGPSGSVLGVDRAPEAVAAAAARAEARGLRHVAFRRAAFEEMAPGSPVDALIGRFVLMHQADPARALGAAARQVRPGGLVTMLESHMIGSVPGVHSHPPVPTYDRLVRWLIQTISAAGAHADMGLGLRQAFLDAGLPAPTLWLQARVEGGRDAPIYRYLTESLRSMLPLAQRLGIATPSPAEVDALEGQLREEVTARRGVLTSPLVVGAWCRVPRAPFSPPAGL